MNSVRPTNSRRRPGLSGWILIGLVSGIACGLFFGEYCKPLATVGNVFIGLLRMTVLPYIMVSLVANLGRLTIQESRRLAVVGGLILLTIWSLTLFTVTALSHTFPEWKAGSFFSSASTEEPPPFDFVSVFIPSNIFASLSDNQVPAVVLLCICIGIALSKLARREALIQQLDDLAKILIQINVSIIRLAPIGVFAMAAHTAGTLSFNEIGRLQAYLATYTAGCVFLGLFVLPYLVMSCTPLKYSDVMYVAKDAMITAFATGKLVIVLPLLIERTEKLFERQEIDESSRAAPAVDVLFPVAYPFPHAGKLLSILFIPFAAWFLGNSLSLDEFPQMLGAGLFSFFGGPLLAIPHLLDLMQLPRDMFQLFILSGVFGERIGDALGVMHLTAFTLMATCAFTNRLQLDVVRLARFFVVTTALGVSMTFLVRTGLSNTIRYVEQKEDILAEMQLLEEPVESVVLSESLPNPTPKLEGELALGRIRRRGVIRVGYNEDKLPFAFFNIKGELVGFDVDMAHALARDLGVRIEFVRFNRATLAEQLANDEFDVVMSGLVGTLERAQAMRHTSPYLDVHLGLVVRDFQAREFRSLESLRNKPLRIGFVDLSRGFVTRLQEELPKAELVELETNQEFFNGGWESVDALLIGAENGSAYTLLHPDFEVVIPRGLDVSLPLFYVIGGGGDIEFRDFLEHWVSLRTKDGTVQRFYDHWVLGKIEDASKPRWSIIRDVLHWVD